MAVLEEMCSSHRYATCNGHTLYCHLSPARLTISFHIIS